MLACHACIFGIFQVGVKVPSSKHDVPLIDSVYGMNELATSLNH